MVSFNAIHSPLDVPDNALLKEFSNIGDEGRKSTLGMIYRMGSVLDDLNFCFFFWLLALALYLTLFYSRLTKNNESY